MKQKITIQIETPEDVSLFEAVKGFVDELGSFYNTSARFDIDSNVGNILNLDIKYPEGMNREAARDLVLDLVDTSELEAELEAFFNTGRE